MRKLLSVLAFFLIVPMTVYSQGYHTLWKQVQAAKAKDQPLAQITILNQIIEKATKEHAYGHLLAATCQRAGTLYRISPDSITPQLQFLIKAEADAGKTALGAVYSTVLSKIYAAHPNLDGSEMKRKEYAYKAMANIDVLAQTHADDYAPLVTKEVDSSVFGHDLLHIIGLETGNERKLLEYYKNHGNRAAACLLATRLAGYDIQRLDSVISEYADLEVCGHAAIRRYQSMPKASNEERRACYDYLNMALSKWGNWKEMNQLRNAREELTSSTFRVQMEGMLHPAKRGMVYFQDVRNVSELRVHITRTDLAGDDRLLSEFARLGNRGKSRLQQHLVKGTTQTVTASFHNKASYEMCQDSLLLPLLKNGVYLLEFDCNNSKVETQRRLIAVSNLRVLYEELPDNQIRYVVVRADNGQPVPNASVTLSTGYGKTKQTITKTVDQQGELLYPFDEKRKPNNIYISTLQDKAFPASSCWSNFYFVSNKELTTKASVFTDRSVYRPGQTVYANVMAWTQLGIESKVLAGEQLTLTLRDANYREVEKKALTTDDFGTAATQFVLPTSGLNGRFILEASVDGERAVTSIQVEEYKRPTFEVLFDEYKEKYAIGDTITLQGRAMTYSGVPVQGAKVEYTVSCRPIWWRGGYNGNFNEPSESIYQAETITGEDGALKVDVPLVLNNTLKSLRAFYRFQVRAKVTDLAGESHEGVACVPVGSKAAFLSTDLPQKILSGDVSHFILQYQNAAGEAVDAVVRYGIFASEEQLNDSQMAKQASRTCQTNKKQPLEGVKSGKWTLYALCDNDTLKHEFVVFSLKDKTPAVETRDWFYQTSEVFPDDGSPVYIQIGASDDSLHIVYTVIAKEKVLESGSLALNNALALQKFTYKEEYGDGLRLSYAWVHDGITYTHSATISRPLPNKELKLTWKTFRDCLAPGQEEEWTLEVKKADGTPADAQLMATLFDKSLLQIAPHHWEAGVNMNTQLPFAQWRGRESLPVWANAAARYAPLSVEALSFSRFDEEYIGRLMTVGETFGLEGAVLGTSIRIRGASPKVHYAKQASVETNSVMDMEEKAVPAASSNASLKQVSSVQLREDLQYTAFFYPQLRTDSLGFVSMKFKLPQSVTTWQFKGLAHDRDMNNGVIEADIVARKDIMVQPNLPRFIRQGDKPTMSTRISNTTENVLQGTTRFQLLDPVTNQIVWQQEQPFAVEGKHTVGASFAIPPSVLDGHEGLLIARIMAEGAGFADGEQHYLPVLANKEYVINTLPFSQMGKGKDLFGLEKLFTGKDIEKARLTIEYTNNPNWLMIQALPYVADANEKNAISLAASLYANTLARHIVDKNPQIKSVFEQWKRECGTLSSLQSQLEKNQDLKSLVLSETPWVQSAQKEAEQHRTIALYFDENQLEQVGKNTLQALKKLQRPDGSFSWWEGMDGSLYMTVAVTKMLVRLQAMTGQQEELESITAKAFNFLDQKVAERVLAMKDMEKRGKKLITPSNDLCDYLYINALAGRKSTKDTDYLLRLLSQKPVALSIYGKANTAVILSLYGYADKAKDYVQSIKEYTVYKEGIGRYFDTPAASYSWFDYRIPTEVAAIEAIKMVAPKDSLTIREMQQWLLQSKRTQAWDTPINSVNAIWAFADAGHITELANPITEQARFFLDGKELQLKANAGLGYVRHEETLSDGEKPQKLIVEKTSNGTAWGAVYAQYVQPLSEIKSSSAGFSIHREVLDEKGNAVKKLKIGDKVRVRLTIQADRDYDFVQIQDKRAACLEPVSQRSGYQRGCYIEQRDQAANFFFDRMAKGRHIIEAEYYVDREGDYQMGICTVQCAYASEYSGRAQGKNICVIPNSITGK